MRNATEISAKTRISPWLIKTPGVEGSFAWDNLQKLEPKQIKTVLKTADWTKNGREVLDLANSVDREALKLAAIAEVDEVLQEVNRDKDHFNSINLSEELMDVLVLNQKIAILIATNFSIDSIFLAVEKKLMLANSSAIYERTAETIDGISLLKSNKESSKKAVVEVIASILAIGLSNKDLPEIVFSMGRTISLNKLNYPEEYFGINPSEYSREEVLEIYLYRKSLCRFLRDEKMIGRDLELEEHKKNVFIFSDIILNRNLELELALALLKERVNKMKQTEKQDYKILIPGEKESTL